MKPFLESKAKNNIRWFIILFLLNLLFSLLILLYNQTQTLEYEICDKSEIHNLSFNNKVIEFKYPVNNCDDIHYFSSIENFENLFNEDGNMYQGRPLYVLSINFLDNIFDFFKITKNTVPVPILSFYIFQILIISISQLYLIIYLNNYQEIFIFDLIFISILSLTFPLLRFGVYKTSNQLFTFLIIPLAFSLVRRNDSLSYKTYLFIGILFLFNRSIVIVFLYIILIQVFKSKSLIKNINNLAAKTILFISPTLLYNFYIYFNEYEKVDKNTDKYGQFIWIQNYFVRFGNAITTRVLNEPRFEYIRFESNWHCVNIPENFICYGKDTLLTFQYLILLIILIIIFIPLAKVPKQLNLIIFQISLLSYLFWSFIGWYPPIRFNLYTIGNVALILAIIQVVFIKKLYLKTFFVSIWIYISINLDHWNTFNF